RATDDGHRHLVGDGGFRLSGCRQVRVSRPDSRVPDAQCPDDLVEQVTNPGAMLGGYFEHRVEPELIELQGPGLGALVVSLVDCDDDGQSCLAKLAGYRLVRRNQTFAAVHEKNEQVRAGDRPLPLPNNKLMQRIFTGAIQASSVEE